MSFIYENVEKWLRREALQSGEPYEFLRLVWLIADELLEEGFRETEETEVNENEHTINP